ncbi:MAG: mechanosensitive ion channel family protein [Kiritimatiellae bacterium]|nr:mechanosensitive ion channel family protein [Kiritimatiellia bacterium]
MKFSAIAAAAAAPAAENAATTNSACGGLYANLAEEFSQGRDICNQTLAWLAEKGVAFAVDLVVSAVILLLGWLAIRTIVSVVGKAVTKSDRRNTLFANFIRNVTSKICWCVLIVVVLGKLGVNVGPIIAGLGVTGFILGFAFQESLGNLASGLMIAINEPFKIGDYVIIAGHEGTVMKVDMMATTLATADNKKIVIPNKSAWGGPIVNFTALLRRRVDVKIGVDYACNLAKAISTALSAAAGVRGVLADPPTSVSIASMDDSQVTLNIRPWAKCADYWSVYNDVLLAVKTAFEREGIAIPFPQMTVHMEK